MATEAAIPPSTLHLIFDSQVLARGGRSQTARGGVYRYAQQLLAGLQITPGLEVRLYCRDPLLQLAAARRGPRGALGAGSPLVALAKPLWQTFNASGPSRYLQRRQLMALLNGTDPTSRVYHSPFTPVPQEVRRARMPVVLTVHDLLPRQHPEWFETEARREFARTLNSLNPEDHVICVSQASRSAFLELGPAMPESHVHAIPLAASAGLAPLRDSERLEAIRRSVGASPGQPLILALGTLEPRKNLTQLLTAFELLHFRQPALAARLVIAGARGWQMEALLTQVERSPARQAIHLAGHLPDPDLPALYTAASLLVFPSLQEGFGLPPLEAMACGTPVVCSDRPALPEVVGHAALLVNPNHPEAIAEAMERVLCSADLAARLRQAGLERAALFSWNRTVERTVEVYRQALRP